MVLSLKELYFLFHLVPEVSEQENVASEIPSVKNELILALRYLGHLQSNHDFLDE